MKRVLVVDDEALMRTALETTLARRGWQVQTAAGAGEALVRFRLMRPPLVITDVRMADGSGLDVMREVRRVVPGTAVILLTAFASVAQAVEAMKDGACDYLVKPVSGEQLEAAAERVLAGTQAIVPETEAALIGEAPNFLAALERARLAAASDADILMEAESGTGKELVARRIHAWSARARRPLVAVNCAAFPEALLESELFGHTKGAFTGAAAAKPGKFELADGGTLLLDEVGEMPLTLQPKLLRVLQEREFDRLGGTRAVRVELRVIATTNRSLEKMVGEGRFRSDLYYRLNVIPLSLPPLRERRADIGRLARHFLRLYQPAGREMSLSPAAVRELERHSWPGNVRELANAMRRAVALAAGDEIGPGQWQAPGAARTEDSLAGSVTLEAAERLLFTRALEATGGNRSHAAAQLGVSLRTVRNKIREYGLPPRSGYAHS